MIMQFFFFLEFLHLLIFKIFNLMRECLAIVEVQFKDYEKL